MKLSIKSLLTAACALLIAESAIADDEADFGGGELSCAAKYHTYYDGYMLSADGTSTNSIVEIKLSQRAKNGVATAVMTVTDIASRRSIAYTSGAVHMPETVWFSPINADAPPILATVTAYCIASRKGEGMLTAVARGENGSSTLTAFDALSGNWTLALACKDDTNAVVAIALQVKRRGRTNATCILPDGWKVTKSSTLIDVNGATSLTLSLKRSVKGKAETLVVPLSFDATTLEPKLETTATWMLAGDEGFKHELEILDFGLPGISSMEIKRHSITADDDDLRTASINSFNDKTGVFKGKCMALTVGNGGRIQKKKGTIQGIAINGVGYGSATIKNVLTTPIVVNP